MEADPLYNDPDLARFYDIENEWGLDFDYCRNLAASSTSVLDLGCGTGRFAAAIAEEGRRRVVGVDPAEPMLDVARRRDGGTGVRWVNGDARRLRLVERFDLVLLTGHAFQVFLTSEDQSAVLRTIALHLAPHGRFIFDTRNPAIAAWREWTPARSQRRIQHPTLGNVLAWNDVQQDATSGIVTYRTYYKLPDGRICASQSKIAFPSREDLLPMIWEAGLVVERWLGDWLGAPSGPATTEIIPIGRLR